MTIRYTGPYEDPGSKVELTCDGCEKVELSAMQTLRPIEEYSNDWIQLRSHPRTPALRKGTGDYRPVHTVSRHDFCSIRCVLTWSAEMYIRIKQTSTKIFRDPEGEFDNQGNLRCEKCGTAIYSQGLAWACECDSAYYVVGVDFGPER